MSDRLNTLAWVAVALAVLVWAFAPQLAWANAVYFPPPPKVETSLLPLSGPVMPPPVLEQDG